MSFLDRMVDAWRITISNIELWTSFGISNIVFQKIQIQMQDDFGNLFIKFSSKTFWSTSHHR